jgi:hypothetical protein
MCRVTFLWLLAATAWAQDDSAAEREKLGARMVELANMSKTVESTMDMVADSMSGNLVQMIVKSTPQLDSLTPQQRDVFQKSLAEYMKGYSVHLRAEIKKSLDFGKEAAALAAPIYASEFTSDELTALIAFYESSVGRKLVQVTPNLQQKMVQAIQKDLMPRMIEVISRVSREQQEQQKTFVQKLIDEVSQTH